MPPPPRRRRPVQPATRVRLPRTARPRDAAASEEAQELTTAAPSSGDPGPGNGHTAAPVHPDDTQPQQTPQAKPGPGSAEESAPASVLTEEAAADGATAPGDEVPEAAGDRETRPATGAQLADGTDAAEPAGDRRAGEAADGEHVREPLLLPVCLGIVAVALGGLAVWFGLNSGGTPTGFGTGTPNTAVVDHAATARVTQQIDKAVDTIFSYNYADTARTSNAAKDVLTGPASAQYATLFKVVRQEAPKEKLVLTTTVTNSGVENLNGDTARLLIFANQKDTGATKASTTEAGAMFAVTAVKQNGQWKIYNIDTFSAPG